MDIISYRRLPPGQPKAGGNVSVSAALDAIASAQNSRWYGWVENDLIANVGPQGEVGVIATFETAQVEGLYRFANAVFWPLLHSYPQHVEWSLEDNQAYEYVQWKTAQAIVATGRREPINVHDYQLFFLPGLLKQSGIPTTFFLHLPFPKAVPLQHLPLMRQAVKGMLAARVIGFHTREYVDAFLSFVENFLWTDYEVDRLNATVVDLADAQTTKLKVSPIGTNAEEWSQMAQEEIDLRPELEGMAINMLVARSDPAKGVPAMIEAWDLFQQRYPLHAYRRALYIISTPSREMVTCFREERLAIEREAQRVQAAWPGTLVLQNTPLSAPQLAGHYRRACVLLSASLPSREGWGLTGPEFVACQEANHGGVVGMSRGVGAFSLFGDCVVELDPEQPSQMADALAFMNEGVGTAGAVARMRKMKARIPTMDRWWRDMQLDETAVAEAA